MVFAYFWTVLRTDPHKCRAVSQSHFTKSISNTQDRVFGKNITIQTRMFLNVIYTRRTTILKPKFHLRKLFVGVKKNMYEVWLLNIETARLEGALDVWGKKRVVRWVSRYLVYARPKTRFRHYDSICAVAV